MQLLDSKTMGQIGQLSFPKETIMEQGVTERSKPKAVEPSTEGSGVQGAAKGGGRSWKTQNRQV